MITRIQPLNIVNRIRSAHQAKIINKFFQIGEEVSPEIIAQLEGAKSGIANYAKANNVTLAIKQGSDGNVIDLLITNLDKKPMIGKITMPVEYVNPEHIYNNAIVKVSKENGLNVFNTVGKSEDNFLRHLYRKIEFLVDSMKK